MSVNTTASVSPAESSTLKVTASFTDESGAAVTPTAVSWTLTDSVKNVVNARQAVALTAAASITFALTANDLALVGYVGAERVLLLEWSYTSTLGTNLPGKAQLLFNIVDILARPV